MNELRIIGKAVINVSRLLAATSTQENGQTFAVFAFDNGQEIKLRSDTNTPLAALVNNQNPPIFDEGLRCPPERNSGEILTGVSSSASIAPTASSST